MLKGRYSSMMDMGGVPSATAKTKLDMGKNNKIRAVALDFELITRSIESHRLQDLKNKTEKEKEEEAKAEANAQKVQASLSLGDVKPRTDVVSSIADLLGIKMGGDDGDGPRVKTTPVESEKSEEQKALDMRERLTNDIRVKYAKKLRDRVDGGLAGVDVAKGKREEMLTKGDAGGHFAARSLAAANTVSTSGSKWLATTGTGNLLSFLSKRSMMITLLPSPRQITLGEQETIRRDMESLTRQLPSIKFDLLLDGVTESREDRAGLILGKITDELETEPLTTLVVSDQDAYLKSARDLGFYTCRVRRQNAPRGNITANYTSESVEEVQDVVNELVGLSFNTVFSSAK